MNNSEMQQNLYKILRMNIILAKSSGEIVSEDTLQNFDDAAKKIDEIDNSKYDSDIKELYYSTTTLDDESKRLDKLIGIIEKRLEARQNLIIDYKETTNRELEALGYIKDEDKLIEYKERLNNINNYLSNKENIIKIEEELKELHINLDKCYENKQKDESNNFELEDDLLLTFKNIISNSNYSDILTAVDVDFEIEKLKPEVEETKKTLTTFETAFNNLKKAGISIDSEAEYSSYVEESKKTYYFIKEKEFLFNIYKIIIDSKNIYSELYSKRDGLDKVLEERLHLRVELGIYEEDILNELYNLIDKQNKNILKQKENIDSMSETEEKIKFKEKRLNELKDDNQKVEILSLLQEFGIIDTYKSDVVLEIPNLKEEDLLEDELDFEDDEEFDLVEEEVKIEEPIIEEDLDPNTIIEVKDVYENLNLSFAKSKADTVMRRVGRSLGYAPEVKKENLEEEITKEEIKEQLPEVIEKEEVIENKEVEPVTETVETVEEKIEEPQFEEPKIEETKEVATEPKQDNFLASLGERMNFDNLEANNFDSVDNDFWGTDSDMFFPTIDGEVKFDNEQSGFNLDFPLNFGGNDESRD